VTGNETRGGRYVVTGLMTPLDAGCSSVGCAPNDDCCFTSPSVFCVSDDQSIMADNQIAAAAAAAEPCEIFVSNIPATDNVAKLTTIFESERVTGVADCSVMAVTYDSTDSTCAVVKFTDDRGCIVFLHPQSLHQSLHV